MAPKETTLQIKQFRGINRIDEGTNTPPNEFFELKNLHIKSPGEIESIGGVADLSATDLPGCAKIITTKFMKDARGQDLLLCFYRPKDDLASWIPNITISNFSNSGTGVIVETYIVSYVGPGGYVYSKEVTSGANNLNVTFTVPNDVPDWVSSIDVYAKVSTHRMAYRFLTFRRKLDGTFRASAEGSLDCLRSSSFSSAPTLKTPDRIYSEHSVLNSKKETWYFGLAPFFIAADPSNVYGTHKPRVTLVDSNTPAEFLTADVDPENGSTIKMGFATQTLTVNPSTVNRMTCFAGVTPEDLTAVGHPSNYTDVDSTIELELVEYSITSTSAGSDLANVTQVSSGAFADGDKVLYRDNGGSITGLTDNTTYYIKFTSTGTAVHFYANLSDYQNDIKVNITSVTTGTPKLYLRRVSFFVDKSSLINSRNNVQMVRLTPRTTANYTAYDMEINKTPSDTISAVAGRTDGVFTNAAVYRDLSGTVATVYNGAALLNLSNTSSAMEMEFPYDIEETVGCWVLRSLPFSLANAYQLLPGVNERSLSTTALNIIVDSTSDYDLGEKGYGSFWNPNKTAEDEGEHLSVDQYRQRLVTANGDNQLWHTNGYVWKPIMRSDGKSKIPQNKFVKSFSNRIISGGGIPSIQSTDNLFHFSEEETPYDWGTTINSFAVFSGYPINGLGVYSQNLSDSGYRGFLVVSKKDGLWMWNGNSSEGPQQLYKSIGFAGPRAFCVTDYGPVFLSRENAFLISGEEIKDIGDEAKDILEGLTDEQLYRINAVYHNRILKIAYPSTGTGDVNCDKELWLEFRTEQGGLQKYWSGPHDLTDLYDQASIIDFNGTRDVRVGCLSDSLHQRDSGANNLGASIARSIVISRLGLNADHFLKVIRGIYLAVNIPGNESFTITLDAEDGSSQMVASKDALVANGARHLVQFSNPNRFLGRVNKVTITQTSSTAFSLYDISIIFSMLRRRLLRY
jgi:hypothetical protein